MALQIIADTPQRQRAVGKSPHILRVRGRENLQSHSGMQWRERTDLAVTERSVRSLSVGQFWPSTYPKSISSRRQLEKSAALGFGILSTSVWINLTGWILAISET